MSKRNGRIDSLLRLSSRVTVLSWISCGLALVTSLISCLELSALRSLNPEATYSWDVDYVSSTVTLLGGANAFLSLVAFIVAGFFSLRWVYRANSNAHRLNSDLPMSAGWNVGWFFVPIASWWKPYQGVEAVWRISTNPEEPASLELPAILPEWWAFWLVTNIAGSISFRLQMHAASVRTAMIADMLDIVSSITYVPATYFFLSVVRDISAKQQRFAREEGRAELLSSTPSEGSA